MYGDPVIWFEVAAPRLRAAAALLGRPGVESCDARSKETDGVTEGDGVEVGALGIPGC